MRVSFCIARLMSLFLSGLFDVRGCAEHLFQNQCLLNRKGQSSMGTALGSTNSKPTRMVSTITHPAKKMNVPHCRHKTQPIIHQACKSSHNHASKGSVSVLQSALHLLPVPRLPYTSCPGGLDNHTGANKDNRPCYSSTEQSSITEHLCASLSIQLHCTVKHD